MTARIEGTIPALLTPFSNGGAVVDLDLLDDHVAWLAEHGVRCVAPMGTTGEGPSLALAERKLIIERLCAHPSGVAVLAGTGATSLPETIELSLFAVEQGAAGILVAPPSYYAATPRGITGYYTSLFDALPDRARVFLYHIPSHTGVPIGDETLHALVERYGERLAGAKDSGGDPAHTAAWLATFTELTILPGSDAAVAAAYEAGARGTLTMLANVLPQELEEIRAGEGVEARQRFLTDVRALVGEVPRHAALKHLLSVVSGLPRSSVRPPLEDLDDAQIAYLETRFSDLRSEAHV